MIHQSFLLAELPDCQPTTLLLSQPLSPRTLQRQISPHDSLLKQSKIDCSRLSWAARWRSPDRYYVRKVIRPASSFPATKELLKRFLSGCASCTESSIGLNKETEFLFSIEIGTAGPRQLRTSGRLGSRNRSYPELSPISGCVPESQSEAQRGNPVRASRSTVRRLIRGRSQLRLNVRSVEVQYGNSERATGRTGAVLTPHSPGLPTMEYTGVAGRCARSSAG